LAALVAVFGTVAGWDILAAELRREEPYRMRRLTAESSIEMTADRPWTGFGLGTWQVVYPAYARVDDGLFDNQAHNDWVQWAAEGGVPMVALMVTLAVTLAPAAVRSVWGIGLLFVLAHCAVEYHFQQRPGFGCLFFLVAGAVVTRKAGAPVGGDRRMGQGRGAG
jgi:O-antigen ligase